MTMKLTESFDWLETADLPGAYSAFGHVQPTGTMTATIQESGGRNGGKCLRIIPGSSGTSYLVYNLQGKSFPTGVAGGNTVVCHFAVKVNTFHDAGLNLPFAAIASDGGNGDSLYNLILFFNSAHQITIGYSSGGSLANTRFQGTSSTVVLTGVWVHVAIKFKSSNTVGTIEVQINGVTEIGPLSSKDTLDFDSGVSALVLGATIPSSTVPSLDFDDIIICDTTGSFNNDFLGDCILSILKPNGNGNTSNMVGSDANSTDNYLLVDDGPAPDDDTTYVESGTVGNKDTYTYENTPAGIATIKCVTVKTLAKKVTAGAQDLKAVARSNTTETDSGALGFTTAYTARSAFYETDPDTAAAWGTTAFNAAEFGVKVA